MIPKKFTTKTLVLGVLLFLICIVFFALNIEEYSRDASKSSSIVTQSKEYNAYNITLQPGMNEAEINLCWYLSVPKASSVNTETSVVKLIKANEIVKDTFLDSGNIFKGDINLVCTSADENIYYCKATADKLTENTEYAYAVGDGSIYSEVYNFKTEDTKNYNVIFVGDAQIGASGNINSDSEGWKNTIATALKRFSNTSFILSSGDQVDDNRGSETEYDAFFSAKELTSVPFAPVIGNNDNHSIHSNHFNVPNESTEYGQTTAGGDYWFIFGNTLYMILNTNNTDVLSHSKFIEEAIATNPKVTWRVVVNHQSLFGSAQYVTSLNDLRAELYPVFDQYDIDVVLAGHDHCYARTYQLLGGIPQIDQKVDDEGRVVNPSGTLFITANSSSGSKYYDLKNYEGYSDTYFALTQQLNTPAYMNLEVSSNTLTISAYRVDNGELLDTYSIYKTP